MGPFLADPSFSPPSSGPGPRSDFAEIPHAVRPDLLRKVRTARKQHSLVRPPADAAGGGGTPNDPT